MLIDDFNTHTKLRRETETKQQTNQSSLLVKEAVLIVTSAAAAVRIFAYASFKNKMMLINFQIITDVWCHRHSPQKTF
jgi:hypothetical protein